MTCLHAHLTRNAHKARFRGAIKCQIIRRNGTIFYTSLRSIVDTLISTRASDSYAHTLALSICRRTCSHAHHASIARRFHFQSGFLQFAASFVGADTSADSGIFHGGSKIIGDGVHIGRSSSGATNTASFTSNHTKSQGHAHNGVALIGESNFRAIIGSLICIIVNNYTQISTLGVSGVGSICSISLVQSIIAGEVIEIISCSLQLIGIHCVAIPILIGNVIDVYNLATGISINHIGNINFLMGCRIKVSNVLYIHDFTVYVMIEAVFFIQGYRLIIYIVIIAICVFRNIRL